MAKFITYANGATEWRLQSISWRIGKGISILRLDVNFDWDYRSVKGRRPHPLEPRRNGGWVQYSLYCILLFNPWSLSGVSKSLYWGISTLIFFLYLLPPREGARLCIYWDYYWVTINHPNLSLHQTSFPSSQARTRVLSQSNHKTSETLVTCNLEWDSQYMSLKPCNFRNSCNFEWDSQYMSLKPYIFWISCNL